MQNGKDGTRTMTSLLPSRSTATTSCAPQSENHRRPSCQRGDSPKAMPVIRVCSLATEDSFFRPLTKHNHLCDLDAIAHHPQLQLLQTYFQALFELSHPLAIPSAVGDIHDAPYQVVPIENPTVTPVLFHSLGLITGRSKVLDDFKHCLGDPFAWDVSSIIEPEG